MITIATVYHANELLIDKQRYRQSPRWSAWVLQNVNGNIVDTIIRDKRTSTKDDDKPTVMNGQRIENESINDVNEKPHFYRQIDGDMKPVYRYRVVPPLPLRDLARKILLYRRKVDTADNDPLSFGHLQSFSCDFLSRKKEESFKMKVARSKDPAKILYEVHWSINKKKL